MISGDEWREAFLTGLVTGICGTVALVVLGVILRAVWLARRAAEADRDSADYAAAARAAFGTHPMPNHLGQGPRRLTEQDIVDRAAGNPAKMVLAADESAPCICGTVFEINGLCQAKVHSGSSSRRPIGPKP
jgi:hypothetical protein